MAAWAHVVRGLSWGATVHTGDYMWALLPRDSANANGYTKNGGQLRYRVTLSRTVLSGSIGGQLNAGHQWHTPVEALVVKALVISEIDHLHAVTPAMAPDMIRSHLQAWCERARDDLPRLFASVVPAQVLVAAPGGFAPPTGGLEREHVQDESEDAPMGRVDNGGALAEGCSAMDTREDGEDTAFEVDGGDNQFDVDSGVPSAEDSAVAAACAAKPTYVDSPRGLGEAPGLAATTAPTALAPAAPAEDGEDNQFEVVSGVPSAEDSAVAAACAAKPTYADSPRGLGEAPGLAATTAPTALAPAAPALAPAAPWSLRTVETQVCCPLACTPVCLALCTVHSDT